MALKAIDLIVVPSSPSNTDLMCFSPTIFPLIVFKFSIINLGSGNAITINELTNKMKVIAGYSGNSIYADSDETFGTARVCDNNKAVKLLCFDPKINIDKGLKITYDWMKNAEH